MKDFFLQIKNIYEFYNTSNEWKKNIFYSEGKNYFLVFKDYIDYFLQKKKKIIFITSDIHDPVFKISDVNLKIFYCKNIFLKIILLNSIKCINLIMTMPDLNNYEIKKSKLVNNYIYLFHSLVSTDMIYRECAFDNYDKIFCITKNQYNELETNRFRKGLEYKLIKSNYPKLDFLKKNYSNKLTPTLITIAPSWGDENIFNLSKFDQMIGNLILNNYNIILRPHNQKLNLIMPKLENILKKYGKQKLKIHYSNRDFDEILSSEYLITDWSGIALEYAFTTYRPVIFIDTEKKILNKTFNFNPIQKPTEVFIRDKIGLIVSKKNIISISNQIKKINLDKIKENIIKEEKKILFKNFSLEKNFNEFNS